MRYKVLGAGLALLAAATGAGLLTGCSEAQAEPLEVTYYYLPG
jgi:hypothetical protein